MDRFELKLRAGGTSFDDFVYSGTLEVDFSIVRFIRKEYP